MLFRDIYKVLVVADEVRKRTPMRLHGEAILQQLRDVHHIKLDIVHNTEDALTEIERDASVATVLVEWGDEDSTIDTRRNDLKTILFLVTPGIESSKAGTLISALVSFKRLFDRKAVRGCWLYRSTGGCRPNLQESRL